MLEGIAKAPVVPAAAALAVAAALGYALSVAPRGILELAVIAAVVVVGVVQQALP